MANKKSNFQWNYYQYVVINETTGKVYNEYEDVNIALMVCKDKNNENQYKYIVQQIHNVARIIH